MSQWITAFYILVLVVLSAHSTIAQDTTDTEQILINEFYARVPLKKIVKDLETKYRLEIDCDPHILDQGAMPPLSFTNNLYNMYLPVYSIPKASTLRFMEEM